MPVIDYELGWVLPEERDYSTAKLHDQLLNYAQMFEIAAPEIKGSGEGKVVLLYVPHEKAFGGVAPDQVQATGSCVGHGYNKGVQILRAVQDDQGQRETDLNVLGVTEWIYFTSRVLVGGGRLGRRPGSLGSWAAEAVKKHGTLLRKVYTVGGKKFDLTSYSGQREKDWARGNEPAVLEPIADEHPVGATALVTTWEAARDSISNGYPVPVCSRILFDDRRDSEGFAKPKGKGGHCTTLIAIDDDYKRPGGLLDFRSWGRNWCGGPRRHNQPEGTIWVDAEVLDKMLKEKDSYALSNFKGFKARTLNYNVW